MNIELYWIPGCTACLRMKEFVESSGLAFDSVNVDEDPARAERLLELGASAPAAVVDGRWADGCDLAAVARLLDVPYDAREPCPPGELQARYEAIMAALCRHMAQVAPEVLDTKPPSWEWTLRDISHHGASVMREFLFLYDPDAYPDRYEMDYERNRAPGDISSAEQIVDHATETLTRVRRWWEDDGHDDPLDRVVDTYWGHQTLHAAFEREVWHTAQHVRQVEALLSASGIEPDGPLGPSELDGLPMPERLFT